MREELGDRVVGLPGGDGFDPHHSLRLGRKLNERQYLLRERRRGALGDGSRVEKFFGSLKGRTSASFKDINAGRSRIASLDGLMNMSFAYYNGLRFHKGIGRAPDRASHYHREGRLPVLRRPRGIDISRLGSRGGGQQAG
jgi:hypothetical protein